MGKGQALGHAAGNIGQNPHHSQTEQTGQQTPHQPPPSGMDKAVGCAAAQQHKHSQGHTGQTRPQIAAHRRHGKGQNQIQAVLSKGGLSRGRQIPGQQQRRQRRHQHGRRLYRHGHRQNPGAQQGSQAAAEQPPQQPVEGQRRQGRKYHMGDRHLCQHIAGNGAAVQRAGCDQSGSAPHSRRAEGDGEHGYNVTYSQGGPAVQQGTGRTVIAGDPFQGAAAGPHDVDIGRTVEQQQGRHAHQCQQQIPLSAQLGQQLFHVLPSLPTAFLRRILSDTAPNGNGNPSDGVRSEK